MEYMKLINGCPKFPRCDLKLKRYSLEETFRIRIIAGWAHNLTLIKLMQQKNKFSVTLTFENIVQLPNFQNKFCLKTPLISQMCNTMWVHNLNKIFWRNILMLHWHLAFSERFQNEEQEEEGWFQLKHCIYEEITEVRVSYKKIRKLIITDIFCIFITTS